MKRLMLLRHAKSSWGDPSQSDRDRPLNKRGRAAAEALGPWLTVQDRVPDEILCSSATRTRETVACLSLPSVTHYFDDLYLASPEQIRRRLTAATADCVMVVAHNPGIAAFAERCLTVAPSHPRFQDYPTCALTIADFDISDWTQFDWNTGACAYFGTPSDIA